MSGHVLTRRPRGTGDRRIARAWLRDGQGAEGEWRHGRHQRAQCGGTWRGGSEDRRRGHGLRRERRQGWRARALDDIVKRHGKLDILVNNAGIQHRRPITEWEDEDFDRVIAVNLSVLLPPGARCGAPDAAAQVRAHHQHRLGRGHSRPAHHPCLCGGQGRAARPHALDGGGTGPAGHHGQCAGAGLFRHRTQHRASRRQGLHRLGRSAHARRAAGPSRRNWAAPRSFSPPMPRPMSTAMCWRSMAGCPRRCDQGAGVRPSSTSANFGMSMLPPDRMTPTRLPFMASRSCIRAASGAAPAPSAMVWQQR